MAKPPAEVEFELNAKEMSALHTPIKGKGGFQSFGRRLQKKLDPQTGKISLTDAELGRIVRHMTYDPDGTFEQRLRKAFKRTLRTIIINPLPLFPSES